VILLRVASFRQSNQQVKYEETQKNKGPAQNPATAQVVSAIEVQIMRNVETDRMMKKKA
jgi:hypothetical protein